MTTPMNEWIAWADRLQTVSLHTKEDFRSAANALSEETFGELSAFYFQAERENHLKAINQWLEANGESVPMGNKEKQIRNLLELFAFVARVWGRRPFTTQSLTTSKLRPARPDWSNLPKEMRFIAEPAEQYFKFQYVFSDAGREYIRNHVMPQDIKMLSLVAEQVRRVGYGKIKAWRKPLNMHVHTEAAMVFNLMGVLDAIGLSYEDDAQT